MPKNSLLAGNLPRDGRALVRLPPSLLQSRPLSRPLSRSVNEECNGMPESPGTDIFEIMSTMRAMRRLKPDPVPEELIHKILRAGQGAPSCGNTQRWRFLVVKDPAIKKQVQAYYK